MKTETIVGLFVLFAIGIFFYLSFSIGAFRVDRDNYNSYKAYFEDTGGLELKDPVKIAGVDVGWVADIKLAEEEGKALVMFLVNKKNKLAKNAFGMVRQEGLIGNKYLEIDPGDSSTGILLPGSALSLPSQAPASIGEVLNKFSEVAVSIKDVADSFRTVFASKEGENNMKEALSGFAKASDRMASFSEVLERTLNRNEQNINSALTDFRKTTKTLSVDTPKITKSIPDAVKKAGSAFESLDDTAVQARESFKEIEHVAEKINTGKGLVGKIINEDETYTDFKKTIRGLRDYTSKMQSLDILVDMHSEMSIRDWKTKGYFDLKIRPQEDYFYNLEIVSSEKGSYTRYVTENSRFDDKGNKLAPPDATDQYRYPAKLESTIEKKNDIFFGFQFGKRFDRLAFRIGLFENTLGGGIDYYIPLHTDKMHWITTLEIFDWKGINRRNDTRPHVKWLNKLYFMKNIYTTFGIDDAVSNNSACPFFGAGIRFGDRDLKYILPSIPVSDITR